MGIFKSYIKDGVPLNNRLKYSDSTTIGREPIVQKKIPQTIDAKVPNSNVLTKRVDDLKRIAVLLTQPPGLKYLANETALFALKDKRSVQQRLSPDDPKADFKSKLKAAGKQALDGLGQTAKTIGSTLAQVPLNGTGTHFVKGFNGKSPQTYLSELATAPHTLVRNGKDVYEDNLALSTDIGRAPHRFDEKEDQATELSGGSKINEDKRLKGSQKFTKLKVQGNPSPHVNKIDPKVKKESRTLLGDPGTRTVRTDYTAPIELTTVDKINKLNPHSNEELKASARDLVKFRFRVVTPEENKLLHFRAYIDSFNDNFEGTWNSFNYNGRAENFYTYSGFNRNISIGFKIAAQTRYEMRPLYRKIVYLASTTAPTYSQAGIMRGTLVKMTVGDYIYEMPGFISSVNYSWETDYPWEIAMRNPEAAGGETTRDEEQQELPMILNCNVNFTVIHDFLPETGLRHYITQPPGAGGTENTPFFDREGRIITAKQEGLTPSVEVGQGAFGGPFDQGDFVDF